MREGERRGILTPASEPPHPPPTSPSALEWVMTPNLCSSISSWHHEPPY